MYWMNYQHLLFSTVSQYNFIAFACFFPYNSFSAMEPSKIHSFLYSRLCLQGYPVSFFEFLEIRAYANLSLFPDILFHGMSSLPSASTYSLNHFTPSFWLFSSIYSIKSFRIYVGVLKITPKSKHLNISIVKLNINHNQRGDYYGYIFKI